MTRLSNKDTRQLHNLLTTLGYQLTRQNTHPVYDHPTHPPLSIAGTPGDHRNRSNLLAELKRRHPEAFEQAPVERAGDVERERQRARAARKRRRQAARLRKLRARKPSKPRVVLADDVTGCVGCGYVWKSELDPSRGCPVCGGEIRVAVREPDRPAGPVRQPWEPIIRRAA